MSVTLGDWYRQMIEANNFKSYGDWEIDDFNLQDLTWLGPDLNCLLEILEADQVLKSQLLKMIHPPNVSRFKKKGVCS
jgi:hypothetical protein